MKIEGHIELLTAGIRPRRMSVDASGRPEPYPSGKAGDQPVLLIRLEAALVALLVIGVAFPCTLDS